MIKARTAIPLAIGLMRIITALNRIDKYVTETRVEE
jgi:hypothetical protein